MSKERTTVSIDSKTKDRTEKILSEDYNDRSVSEHVNILLRVFIREYDDAGAYREDSRRIQNNLDPFVTAFEELTTAAFFDRETYEDDEMEEKLDMLDSRIERIESYLLENMS